METPQTHIARARRASYIYKEFAKLFAEKAQEDPEVRDLSVTRAEFSRDARIVRIYFHCPGGKDQFESVRSRLVMYKPSARKALAQALQKRYTPDIRFCYDAQLDKQLSLEQTLERISNDDDA